MKTIARKRRGRRWLLVGLGALLLLAAFGLSGRLIDRGAAPSQPSTPMKNTADMARQPPLVFTYFFYWYDAQTNAHLQTESGLPVHLPADPAPSWRSVDWFRKQLMDMAYAGIDVALAVYWGTQEDWSIEGLPKLAAAKRQLMQDGQQSPQISLFLDTTILKGRRLAADDGKQFLYSQIAEFFQAIPRDQWALVDGRPSIWLYFSYFATNFDQSTLDFVYDRFQREFGVRPYIVREVSWDFAKAPGRNVIEEQPIATEANFKWGAAFDGYSQRGSVASVGPGFDERQIPGRGNAHRSRGDGNWYTGNFERAIASGKRVLVIETWNEIHEASGISETVEFGRTYLDLTRQLVQKFKQQSGGETR
jgi:Domain of unknown function (DUF5010)